VIIKHFHRKIFPKNRGEFRRSAK